MLTTPMLSDIKTFNAKKDKTINFNVIGGNQVVGNNLVIERLDNNTAVYNESQETFNFTHTIKSDSLENGVNYRAKIRTKDINNNWSDFSDTVLFWCFTEPELLITNIDYENQNRVYNQTVLFNTTYKQNENEILQSYRYLLYNSNKELLESFPEKYSDGSTPLIQEVTGLKNSTLYYIEVKTISPHGNIGTTGLINFKPLYVTPQLSVAIEAENLPEQGAIRINTSIVQTILRLYDNNGVIINPEDVEYVKSEWLDMTRVDYAELVGDGSLNTTQSDFFLQLWCKKLPEDKIFLTFSSPYGQVEMFKRDNTIRVNKTLYELKNGNYFKSNELVVGEDEEIVIYMRQEDELIDLKIEKYIEGVD